MSFYDQMITQKDIAQEVGVSVMTVSRALRGLVCVEPELSSKIKQVATQLGYRPDPLIQNLRMKQTRGTASSQGVVIAWVGGGLPRGKRNAVFNFVHPFDAYLQGASSVLMKLGFLVEQFELKDVSQQKSLERLFLAKGIPGILLAPANHSEPLPVLHPERFAMVQVGRSRQHPQIDRVASDAFHSMVLAITKLREAGYQRIGYFDSMGHNNRTERRWEAAFCLTDKFQNESIPPLLIKDEQEFNRERLLAYVNLHQLDAVVSGRWAIWSWLREMSVPQIAFACVNRPNGDPEMPGVNVDFEAVGAAAAQWLVDAVYAGRRGFSSTVARTLSIQGTWHQGNLKPKSG